MRKLVVSALLMSLAAGSAALAAPPTSKATASHKAATCSRQWKAQKSHTETRKAFMAACEKA